jgi:deoxycytidylate deaminase
MSDPSLERWFQAAAAEARKSMCLRSSCGAVLVQGKTLLGTGYNAPPGNDPSHRVCSITEASVKKPKTDRTCCVHAEWRALLAALKTHPRDVPGSTMVFVRVDRDGNIMTSGRPYCTVCSRLTLDAGVGFWALWHSEGIRRYPAGEYHRLSQRYDFELGDEGAGAASGGDDFDSRVGPWSHTSRR